MFASDSVGGARGREACVPGEGPVVLQLLALQNHCLPSTLSLWEDDRGVIPGIGVSQTLTIQSSNCQYFLSFFLSSIH